MEIALSSGVYRRMLPDHRDHVKHLVSLEDFGYRGSTSPLPAIDVDAREKRSISVMTRLPVLYKMQPLLRAMGKKQAAKAIAKTTSTFNGDEY